MARIKKEANAWRLHEHDPRLVLQVSGGEFELSFCWTSEAAAAEMLRTHFGLKSLGDVFDKHFDQRWDDETDRSELERSLKSADRPLFAAKKGGRYFWLYGDAVYSSTDATLEPDQVKLLVWDLERRREARFHRLKQVQAREEAIDESRRERIPEQVRLFVWRRDEGRCVRCAATEDLEFDHIIPVSRGGGSTQRNVQLLCGSCNREKGAAI